jgi:ornithine decarboxylase
VRVTGLSFHVGSQVADPAKYVEAIGACGELIEQARLDQVAELATLDIGGGFPVSYRDELPTIRAFCAPVRRALAALPRSVRVIAEPGRYIAAPAGTSVASVVGRSYREGRWWYYLDDGLYGSYSGQLFDHMHYPVEALDRRGPRHPCVLAGPTCDSIDVIHEDVALPDLQIGDVIVGHMMGAYTAATATDFNFIPRARLVPINETAGPTHAN